ncbi:MAG: sugar phosphate isomerase/epimerase, partial [Saprospiraceae bacterium]|nr:sugar phosphate isomerase/epimerase [Saprospiraceae bacterium]
VGTYALAWSIGVPDFMPANPMTVTEFMEIAAEAGAECVQIADNIPLDKWGKRDWIKIKDYANRLNLDLELGMRGLTRERMKTYLEICQLMDCRLLRLVIDEAQYHPALDEVILLIKEFVPALEEANVRLAVENHDRFSWIDFLEIVQNTDEQWVGICLDSVNSLGKGEGFFQVAKKLIPHTINLHVKDYMICRKPHNMGFEVYGTIAGEGMLPIPWLFEQIKRYGLCHSAILELWTPPEGTIEQTIKKEQNWMRKSMTYLHNLQVTPSIA